ncbi:caspase a-like isoform X2 [Antennarius striatus]|uniref:caspase a-like isoform X2 n=1 Tax=Antennarius striatus TaxID=241820 RepID=UPI0035AEF7F6
MAEDKLNSVRPKFVDKVSRPLIGQLLDDLLLDRVVTRGEKDYVLDKDNLRDEMARRLIDTVTPKGDTASQKMIDHIQLRDPMFCSDLGLSFAPEPKKQQEWSTSLIPTTTNFWKKNQNDPDIYPGTKESIGNRVALLITNIKFANKKGNRNGAEKDEQNMKNLLTGLGYEVVNHTDLTGEEIDKAIIEFSKHPKLEGTDSVVVVIMSHGKLGFVYGVNHFPNKPDVFPTDNIYKHLGSEKCPALLDKPKIIIIQACRRVIEEDAPMPDVQSDDMDQPGLSPSADDEDMEDDSYRIVHKEKDFICLLSCTPDTVSYRHAIRGAVLIQYIVEVFNTFSHSDHLEELFRKVLQRFEGFATGQCTQMASKDRCTITKHFYFYPGL